MAKKNSKLPKRSAKVAAEQPPFTQQQPLPFVQDTSFDVAVQTAARQSTRKAAQLSTTGAAEPPFPSSQPTAGAAPTENKMTPVEAHSGMAIEVGSGTLRVGGLEGVAARGVAGGFGTGSYGSGPYGGQQAAAARQARADPTVYDFPVTGRGRTTKATPKAFVIRNKKQVIREAGLLITVLEDALLYRPGPQRNAPAPELWYQLNLENRAAFELISELVAELKKLNAFLETQSRATNKSKVVEDLHKVGLKVLMTYGKTVAVGAGMLTIGALCMLLQHVGAGEAVENAKLWKNIGH